MKDVAKEDREERDDRDREDDRDRAPAYENGDDERKGTTASDKLDTFLAPIAPTEHF